MRDEQINELIGLISEIERDPGRHCRWEGGPQEGVEGSFTFPSMVFSDTMRRMIKVIYECGFVLRFDWVMWQDEAIKYVSGKKEVEEADFETCCRLITVHARKDRFVDGHLAAMISNGHFFRVIRRAADLMREDPSLKESLNSVSYDCKNKLPSGKDNFLCKIRSELVGTQYYDIEFVPKGRIFFEREPSNKHDRNAIKVINAESKQIGYLPRFIVFWLAQLMDENKIRITGEFCTDPEDHYVKYSDSYPIFIKVYLCSEGKSIFRNYAAPESENEALHEIVRKAYEDVDNYKNFDIAKDIKIKLSQIVKKGAFPETRLLLELIPYKADLLRSKLINRIKKQLLKLKPGKGEYYKGLTIFPILGTEDKEHEYILLSKAIDKDFAQVKEVDEDGRVNVVRIRNDGSNPIFIPEGEILTGGKQNRMVIISTIVSANTEANIPVSCIEKGRWEYKSDSFETGKYCTPSIRQKAFRRLSKNEENGGFRTDQDGVWQEVINLSRHLNTKFERADLTEVYKTFSEQVKKFRGKVIMPESAVGFMAMTGEKLLAIDLFDSTDTAKHYWEFLSEAYYADAMSFKKKKTRTKKSIVDKIFNEICKNLYLKDIITGEIFRINVSYENISGTCLIYRGSVLHLSAFEKIILRPNEVNPYYYHDHCSTCINICKYYSSDLESFHGCCRYFTDDLPEDRTCENSEYDDGESCAYTEKDSPFWCVRCHNLNSDGSSCPAFPEGIPDDVFIGSNYHNKIMEGQKGDMIFQPKISGLKENKYKAIGPDEWCFACRWYMGNFHCSAFDYVIPYKYLQGIEFHTNVRDGQKNPLVFEKKKKYKKT